MAINNKKNSIDAFENLAHRQGGSFFLREDKVYYASNAMLSSGGFGGDGQYYSAARSLRTDYGLKFKFSIYNYYTDTEEVELGLLINPQDIQIGQSFVASNAYTRQAWVSSLWGSQQKTIACSGVAAAFYLGSGVRTRDKVFQAGITADGRRESLGFINLLSLIAMYRNNGNYHLDGEKNNSLYSKDSGRVINVMDSILLSYDGSEYVGNFNAFTLDESPSRPFSLNYNFEFVVSCMRGEAMDGHLRMNGNELRGNGEDQIPISIQGFNSKFTKTIEMSAEELNQVFLLDNKDYTETQQAEQNALVQQVNSQEELQSSDLTMEIPTENIGDERTNSRGTVYINIAGDQDINDLSDSQIASNLLSLGIEGHDSNAKMDRALSFLNRPSTDFSIEGGASGRTVAQAARAAAESLGFELDPVLLPTILSNEAGGLIGTDGTPLSGIIGDRNVGGSHGVTQIWTPTYERMESNPAYVSYMRGLGYENLSIDKLGTDPLYGVYSSLFLLSTNTSSNNHQGQPVKQAMSYNCNPGNLNTSDLPKSTGTYAMSYINYVSDPSIVERCEDAFNR